MRILIATPLYPPDIGGASRYAKELVKRLRKEADVSVLLYGHLPENIPDIPLIVVEKSRPLFIRLPFFYFSLLKHMRKADVLLAENGPSIELPVLLFSFLSRKPIFFHVGDRVAYEHTQKNGGLRKKIQTLAFGRAKEVLAQSPLSRPEILPFCPHPKEALEQYESSWETHLTRITHLISHGN